MFVVRYVALAALVVWLGALQGTLLGNATTHDSSVAYACGGILVVSLLAMKFLGPPPRAFLARIAIALVMLGLTLFGNWRGDSTLPTWINIVLGFVLLAWYARE